MSAIILPIKKQYSDQIFAGTKIYELRKSVPKQPVNKILVYESQGCGKIVGELEISETLRLPVNDLWRQVRDYAGISCEGFHKYFNGRAFGYAYRIVSATIYDEPIPITNYGLKMPPQGFAYVNS